MTSSRIEWIKSTGDVLIAAFDDDGMEWEDFIDLIPQAKQTVTMAIAMGALDSNKRNEVICELLFHIIDSTDGWGPDGIIDPILKACVSAFLIGDKG